MTSKERILRTIRHQEPDKVPIAPRMTNFIQRKFGSSDWTCYKRIKKYYDFDPFKEVSPNINNYFRNLGPDYLDLPDVTVEIRVGKDGNAREIERVFHTPEGDLKDVTFVPQAGGTYGIFVDPIKKEYMVKDENDLNKLKYIFPDPFKCDLTGIRHISDAFGEDGLTGVYIYSALGYRGCEGRGMEDLMVDYYEDREFLKDYLSILHGQVMKETKACLEAGAEVILAGNFSEGISAGWSPEHFKDLFLPLFKAQSDLAHEYGAVYMHFDDGKMMANLDNFLEEGCDVLQTCGPPPMGDVDLKYAKEKAGGKICLMGHIDLLNVIMKGTPEEIDSTVRETIKIAGPGGGFIIGSNDSLRDETPDRNVELYFEACNRYRDYPINL